MRGRIRTRRSSASWRPEMASLSRLDLTTLRACDVGTILAQPPGIPLPGDTAVCEVCSSMLVVGRDGRWCRKNTG